MTLGEKIGYCAKQKNISIRQLALECSINYNTLYAFIKRGGSRLTYENLCNIASVLGISPNDLIGNELPKENISDAEMTLNLTINSIIGTSFGNEREEKLYLINSFLEANSSLIDSLFKKLKKEED